MDRDYEEVRDKIIDDMLMGKISVKPEGVFLVGMTEKVNALISLFYKVANKLYEKYGKDMEGCEYIVYRGTRPIKLAGNKLIQPIPFSTSLEAENALNWINEEDKCCIWKIRVPFDTKFVCIDNPNEGGEIVLPAGEVIVKDTYEENGISVYDCRFIETKPDLK